jgi:hypothetical protein
VKTPQKAPEGGGGDGSPKADMDALNEARRVVSGEYQEPQKPTLMGMAQRIQTAQTSQYSPLRVMERVLHKVNGLPPARHDIARKAELVAGARDKAEADTIRLRTRVVDPLRGVAEVGDFDSYMFLKRTVNRLTEGARILKRITEGRKREAYETLERRRRETLDNIAARRESALDASQGQFEQRSAAGRQALGAVRPEVQKPVKGFGKYFVRARSKESQRYLRERRRIERRFEAEEQRAIERIDAEASLAGLTEEARSALMMTPRQVGSWTVPKAEAGLRALREQLGEEAYKVVEDSGKAFQEIANDVLRREVETGRMTPEIEKAIRELNDFYAPFKVLRHVTEGRGTEGTGRSIASTQELTKKIVGITSEDFQIQSPLTAFAEQMIRARILQEKNKVMQRVDKLVDLDVDGILLRRLGENEHARPGYDQFRYLKDGVIQRVETMPEIVEAIQGMNPSQASGTVRTAHRFGRTMKFGATAANIQFQARNLIFADMVRQGLVSKYGLTWKNPVQVAMWPLDYMHGIWSEMRSQFGWPDEWHMNLLESGAASGIAQKQFTPGLLKESLRIGPYGRTKSYAKAFSYELIPRVGAMIEQTAKNVGLNRALRIEKVAKIKDPKARQEMMDEIATEIRNYSGSPDFARRGSAIELNLLFMFYNARLQGAAADLARLGGRDGWKMAGAAAGSLGAVIGVPTAVLHSINMSDEYRQWYDKVPKYHRTNNWIIFTDKFFFTEEGERMRFYHKLPKREIAKQFANTIEAGMEFTYDGNPEVFGRWANEFVEGFVPINIASREGEGFLDPVGRMQSVIASTNPVAQVPAAYAAGMDFYRHRETVPRSRQGAEPYLQYRENTPQIFRELGAMVGQPPAKLEQATRGLTGGLITQFMPRPEPPEGFPEIPGPDILMGTFHGSPYTDTTEQWKIIDEARTKERTDQVIRHDRAREEADKLEGSPGNVIGQRLAEIAQEDHRLADAIAREIEDRRRDVGMLDRALRGLGVEGGARAAAIASQLGQMTDDVERGKYVAELARKGIVTGQVVFQLQQMNAPLPPNWTDYIPQMEAGGR